MTGLPIVDALLAFAAALGLRELLPRIVAMMAARKANSTPHPVTNVTVQAPQQTPSVHPRRNEQIPEWMRDTWTRERAEKEAAEAAVHAAEIENRRDARERIAALERANSNHQVELRLIAKEMSGLREATQKNTDLLGTMRDAVLILKARCPRCEDSDPAPAVHRGGAAAVPR